MTFSQIRERQNAELGINSLFGQTNKDSSKIGYKKI